MCVTEALLDEIHVLLQACMERLAAAELLPLPHSHQSHFHVGYHPILFRTTIFSERDKFISFDIIVLNNVYMYYTMHKGELNGGY